MTNSTADTPAQGEQLSHREIMIIVGGLVLGLFLAALDQTIVSTALKTIVDDLNGASHLSWVVTAYLLTSTAATPLYGKIGDLYGRKKIYLFAIILFLVGSALCGAAQNMGQLIAFRALQGIGAGGLFALALAIVGDIIPASDRGRYQGYFGAVFGLASVVGPLVGGYFTDHLSWRWVFYINIPIGLVALAVTTTVLKLPVRKTEHRVDYLGAGLVTAAVTAFILVTVWGGGHAGSTLMTPAGAQELPFTGFAWGSWEIIGLTLAGLALLGLFVAQEARHPEPILPLHLFKNDIFSVSVVLALISGFVMFGAIIFIPQYQQVVKGFSPTKSGLLMLPLTIGIVGGTISSGALISKLGRYRMFPIVGSLITVVGFWLLSRIDENTSQVALSIAMVVTGLGVGLYMQVTTLAVQNSVDFKHMGAGTSATVFFRTLGGALGAAVFGSILNNRLRYNLEKLWPAGQPIPALDTFDRSVLANFTPAQTDALYESYSRGLHVLFLWGIPITVVSFLFALALRDEPLKSHAPVGTQGADRVASGPSRNWHGWSVWLGLDGLSQ